MDIDTERTECQVTRRHALKIVVRSGMVLVCALLAEGESRAAATWEQVGTVDKFPIGVPKRAVLSKGQVIFVLQQSSNRWLAVSALCTHKGGEVRWEPAKKRFFCPLHGATFTADGKNPQGPARTPLAAFPVQLKGKNVSVDAARAPAGNATPGRKGGKKHEEEEEHEEREHRDRKDKHHKDDDD